MKILRKKILKSRLLATRENKILVLQKVGDKIKYTLPGGIKKKTESSKKALVREVEEEIGVKIARIDLKYISSGVFVKEGITTIKSYYSLKKPIQDTPVVLELDKFSAVLWLSWKKAIKKMDLSDKLAIKQYYKNLKD
ncbi:NUDIX domain-containing protein [Flavobacteriaceae bacterium R38]|nr:NUDIX domain-containing protein [Flavobacteriaceae bacterium R38]